MVIDLKTLYGAEAAEQQKRYEELSAYFAEEFGDANALSYFSAPGRTEVGGNHTDHNNGKVLAAAVNLDVIAAVKKTENGVIRLKSVGFPMDTVDTADLNVQEAEKERSASLIRGVCARLKALGYEVGGFDAVTTSRVLKGSGLSSSAAFEVLVVTILSHLYNDDAIDPVEAAQISKFAENVYFASPPAYSTRWRRVWAVLRRWTLKTFPRRRLRRSILTSTVTAMRCASSIRAETMLT